MAVNYYELLQVQNNASDGAIKAALIKARKEEKIDLALLKTAQRILLNPSLRIKYDQSLFRNAQSQLNTGETVTRRVVYLEDSFVDPEPVENKFKKYIPIGSAAVGALFIGLLIGYFMGSGDWEKRYITQRAETDSLRTSFEALKKETDELKLQTLRQQRALEGYQKQIDAMAASNRPLPPAMLMFNEKMKSGNAN